MCVKLVTMRLVRIILYKQSMWIEGSLTSLACSEAVYPMLRRVLASMGRDILLEEFAREGLITFELGVFI